MAATQTPSGRSPLPALRRQLPDPVGEMRFLVKISGVEIGAFSECGGLGVEWDVYSYEEGGLNDFVHKFRGRAKHTNVTLKRGITHQDALLAWMLRCSDRTERHDVTITLKSPDGGSIRAWQLALAFPCKWTGPTLNAGSGNVATETLEIAHCGLTQGTVS